MKIYVLIVQVLASVYEAALPIQDDVQTGGRGRAFDRTVYVPISGERKVKELSLFSLSQMDHPAALHRIKVGVPATVEHSSEAGPETGKWVAETTQSFITFMDALKLRLRAKDQLHPILQELVTGYARFKGSKDWEGRSKMVGWLVDGKHSIPRWSSDGLCLSLRLITLNGMKASEEITEEQSRQARPSFLSSFTPLITFLLSYSSCSTSTMRMRNSSGV